MHPKNTPSQAPPGDVRSLPIADIVIPPHRQPDPDVVRQLVSSIPEVGLLHPITLTPDLELVAGRNRIAAFVELGLTHIEARIATFGMLEREMAEIDENMIRRRLPVLERGRLFARRKELYEALHPEARQHVRGGHARAAGAATERISPAPAFAADAAAKLGTSERTVQEEIRIATALSPEAAELIRGTPLEDEKVRLRELTRLPRDQQGAVARLLVEGRARTVKVALAALRQAAAPRDARGPETLKVEERTEQAWEVLRHLRAAEKQLAKLRAEGAPNDKLLEDEMAAATSHLAGACAQIEGLIPLLVAKGTRRRHAGRALTNVIARPGASHVAAASRWGLKYVWTLHRNPADLRGDVIAVRRRVLAHDRYLTIEIARHPVRVLMAQLEERGCARTAGMLSETRRYEVCVWVYDHCPTEIERAEWLHRRAVENAALASPPPDVWILRPGPRLGDPHEAVRCPTTRACRTSSRHMMSTTVRSTLEVQIPGEYPAYIDLFELVTAGVASDPDDECRIFYRDPPPPESLRKAGEERLRRVEEARRRRLTQERKRSAASD